MSEYQLQVEIVSPSKTLYKGLATAISSQNSDGKFDILPEHGPFISVITKEVKIKDAQNQQLQFPIETAVLECYNNNIRIFIGFEN